MYFIVGLDNDKFIFFLLITMLEALTGVALGLWVSAMTPNIDAANALGPPLVCVCMYIFIVHGICIIYTCCVFEYIYTVL